MNKKFTFNVYKDGQVINMPDIQGRENAVQIGQHFLKEMNGEKFEILEEDEI